MEEDLSVASSDAATRPSPNPRLGISPVQILAELLRPMSNAFSELWLDGEKAATVEWRKDVDGEPGLDVDSKMVEDNGRGIVLDHPVEPLYGDIYLPR